MVGVVTRVAAEARSPAFDRAFYEVKDVTGRRTDPVPDAVNMVSCFGDTDAAEADPDLVPVDGEGRRATRDRRYFDWSYVCPTHEGYRAALLDTIGDCAAVAPDVRLDDVGFPRAGFCRCDRCTRRFEASDRDEWTDWRADVIAEFVRQATGRVPGRVYLTLYPDPYPGHLRTRSGIDPAALGTHVDEFVVPLYDMAYTTTHWVETIASGFRDRLDRPLSVELYAVNVEVENLVRAAEVAAEYAEGVLFAYDADVARTAAERLADGAAGAEDR